MQNDAGANFQNVYYKKVNNIEKQEQPPTDLLKKTQEQVDELVEILHDNVGKAMERETKISDLVIISENLEKGASEFKQTAIVVKRKEWRKHMKTKLVFAVLCAIILLIIILLLVQTFAMQ